MIKHGVWGKVKKSDIPSQWKKRNDVSKDENCGQGCFQVPGLERTHILLEDVLEVNFSSINLILAILVLLKAECGPVQVAKKLYKKINEYVRAEDEVSESQS